MLILLLVLGLHTAAAQTAQKGASEKGAATNQKKTSTQKLAKLIEPWPAPDV